ncbi:phospholipase C domain protein [Vibrio phage 1.262.O._10N.286.51.A9]|nr:phospholipase C domain protein [Vibrio phage 1.262.O._10N.286.51.A9]
MADLDLQRNGFASLLTPEVTEALKAKKTVEDKKKKMGLLDTVVDKVKHPFGSEPTIVPTKDERLAQGKAIGDKIKGRVSEIGDEYSEFGGRIKDTLLGGKEAPTQVSQSANYTQQKTPDTSYTTTPDDAIAFDEENMLTAIEDWVRDDMGWEPRVAEQFTADTNWEISKVVPEWQNIKDNKEAQADIKKASEDKGMWDEAMGYLGIGADYATQLWDYFDEYVVDPTKEYLVDPAIKGAKAVGEGIGYVNDRVDLLTMLSAGAQAGYQSNNALVGALTGIGSGVQQASANRAGEASAQEEARRRGFDENMKEREVLVKEANANSLTSLGAGERAVISAYSEEQGVDASAVNQAGLMLKQAGQPVTPDNINKVLTSMKNSGLLKSPLLFGNDSLNF